MTQLGEAFIPIRATLDKLDGDLAQARGKVEGAMGKIGQIAGNIGKNVQAAGLLALGGIGALGGVAVAAAGGMALLAANAEPLIGLQQGFAAVTARIGESSQEMLGALQDASGGLITNRDLMASFNKAAALVGDDFAKTLPDAMSLVRRASQATGQDMGFLFDSLVTGVGRVSPMILDNLGIQIQLTEVTDRAAQMFGKSAEELSKQEQQMALNEIVMEKLNKAYGDVPDVTPTFAKIKTSIANLKDEIGLKLLPVMAPLVEKLLGLAEKALPVVMDVLDTQIIPVLMQVSDAFGNFLDGLASGEDIFGDIANLIWELGLAFGLTDEQLAGVLPALRAIEDAINAVVTAVSPFIEMAWEWISQNVKLQDVLIALAIAIGSVVIPAIISIIAAAAPVILTFLAVVAVVALLRSAWENNWGGIQEKTQAVIDFIVPLVQNAIAGIRDWWTQNGDQILANAQHVWETIKATIETVINTVREIIIVVTGVIRDAWARHGDEIPASALNFWGAVKDFIENTINTISDIIQKVAGWIQDFWAEHGESIRKGAEDAWEKIKEIVDNAMGAISTIFDTFAALFRGNWDEFLEGIKEIWLTGWENMRLALEAFWDLIKPIFEGLIAEIVEAVQPTLDNLQRKFDTVFDAIGGIVEGVKDIWTDFVDAVKGFWDWISGKVFNFKINLPSLPDWATPGSPLPIHSAWRDFAREMERITIRPRFDLDSLMPVMALVGDSEMISGPGSDSFSGDFNQSAIRQGDTNVTQIFNDEGSAALGLAAVFTQNRNKRNSWMGG